MPDPTSLTTAALYREAAAIRREIVDLKELVDEKLKGLLGKWEEKLVGIDKQLETAERQRIEQKEDTRESVSAALTAQKESADKLEISTMKQLDQISATFDTAFEGVRRDIDGVKERLGKVESKLT